MKNFISRSILLIVVILLLPAFFLSSSLAAEKMEKNIILATTTSTQDSGLLDVLLPVFEKETGFFVKTISVGSGQAMKMGEKGEADVLLVHSPDAEKAFVAQGFGINRMLVMHNDFIIVGPPADPAKIKGMKSTKDALKMIAQAGALFLSRGDNSGPMPRKRDSGKQPESFLRDRNGISRPDWAWAKP